MANSTMWFAPKQNLNDLLTKLRFPQIRMRIMVNALEKFGREASTESRSAKHVKLSSQEKNSE